LLSRTIRTRSPAAAPGGNPIRSFSVHDGTPRMTPPAHAFRAVHRRRAARAHPTPALASGAVPRAGAASAATSDSDHP